MVSPCPEPARQLLICHSHSNFICAQYELHDLGSRQGSCHRLMLHLCHLSHRRVLSHCCISRASSSSSMGRTTCWTRTAASTLPVILHVCMTN